MNILRIFNRRKSNNASQNADSHYEFCPRCDANLTLQKGFSTELPFWNCRGCGEMLINPAIETDDNISWICDGCGEMLNIQPGFSAKLSEWECQKCGYVNKIDPGEIYASEDEYQSSLTNPYKGLSDDEILTLTSYEELEPLGGKDNIILIRDPETGRLYVKKYLTDYHLPIYTYLYHNPIDRMPKLIGIYEGANNLVVIEEYIEGRSLAEVLTEGPMETEKALKLTCDICEILHTLHTLNPPIIHRDIKPSNIILTDREEVYLLDMNVAKWYQPSETEDTKLLGTLYFAAPEQFGFGLKASSDKADIYAVGILLNVLLTGELPKQKPAEGRIWNIIEKCISLEAGDRYTANELMMALKDIQKGNR